MKQLPLLSENKLHVFIADDDLDDISFFRTALEDISGNVKITVARDGRELLEFLQIMMPDIIFLDINMPCMNGIDCLTEIRNLNKYEHIPVIIYSTTTNSHHIDKTYELGASMFFEKPASLSKIKSRLKDILSHTAQDLLPQLARENYVVKA